MEVAILDDDDPEVTVSYDMSRYEVSEAGETSAVVRVSVSPNPEREVVVGLTQVPGVGVSSSDYMTDLPSSVTFMADGPLMHSFTVSAEDDDIDEDEETVVLGFENLPSAGVLQGTTATVAIVDDDERGISVPLSPVMVQEGESGSYEVSLSSEPTGAVTVSVTVSGDADVSVSPPSLEFTTVNWEVAQTVTVESRPDADALDDEAMVSHAASGADYAGVMAMVEVTVDDNDILSTEIDLSVSPTKVGETSGPVPVVVTLELDGAAFVNDTEVSVVVREGTALSADYTVSQADFTITIPAGAVSADGTFTLTPTNDDVDENDETLSVTAMATGLTAAPATVTIEDDDMRGVVVSKALVELEEDAGASSMGTYTVVLSSAPTGTVTVAVNSGDTALATVSPPSLEFTTVNWDMVRTVTVSAVSDVNASDGTTQVMHAVSGADYGVNGVTASPVTVSVSDNETASSSVMLSLNLSSVGEGDQPRPVTVTASLGGAPFAVPVTVTVTVEDGTASLALGDYTASPTPLMIVIPADMVSANGVFTAEADG